MATPSRAPLAECRSKRRLRKRPSAAHFRRLIARFPIVSFPVELKKQLGNRETILALARKKAEALEAMKGINKANESLKERQMITETKKVFALAALIVATGVATVELTRSSAQAAEPVMMTRAEAYAAARVDTAFDLVAALPAARPSWCRWRRRATCRFRLAAPASRATRRPSAWMSPTSSNSAPSVVVETREGTTSTLLRMDAMTLAGVNERTLQQSE